MKCTNCQHILPEGSCFCQYCGSQNSLSPIVQKKASSVFVGVTSMILSVAAAVSVIVATNLQSLDRHIYERINPTLLYIVLTVLFTIVAVAAMVSVMTKNPRLLTCGSFVLAVCGLIILLEGSVFSSYAGQWYYVNYEKVALCNWIWVGCTLVIFVLNLIAMLHRAWRSSIRYRESCYNRVAKLRDYYQAGIITQADYEKTRAAILQTIPDSQ